VGVALAFIVRAMPRSIVVEEQEAEREVVLLGDDGQLSDRLSEPYARSVVYDAAAVHELTLPNRR
jgi:hypothetical protein